MVIKYLFIFLLVLTLIPLGSAELQVGLSSDVDDGIGINFKTPIIPFNNNTAFVNRSTFANHSLTTDSWITSLGQLDNANETQFDSGGDSHTLNIKESWLTTFGSTIWCALTGCAMTGNLTSSADINASTFTLNETTIGDWGDLISNISIGSNISINFGANESNTSGPVIPFLLTNEGVLKINVEEGSGSSTIWSQSGSQIVNLVGDVLNFTGNITSGNRFFLPNGGSIGDNSTCAFIFYNSTGAEISNIGCV